jgi:transcriptional regulator with XRE-family HTH domain
LEKAVGISTPQLSKIENEDVNLNVAEADRLAGFFGLTVDELCFVQYPPATRWPLYLPAGNYPPEDTMMVERVIEACNNFELLSIEERARLMLDFKLWLAQKAEAGKVKAEMPGSFLRLSVSLLKYKLRAGRKGV